jgi:hypothetical protein
MPTTTKIYRNDSKETLDVLGIGEIPAGEQVSVTGEYQPQVILVNYPGLVDVLAEEAEAPVEEPVKEKK